jgi:predicted RNase H-like HicB family nuclease
MSGLFVKFALDGDGRYLATLDDYPGVIGHGATIRAAAARLNSAYASMVRAASFAAEERGVTTMQVLDEWKGS